MNGVIPSHVIIHISSQNQWLHVAVLRSNLWSSQFVTVSQFVTESVAICDGCRDLWQRQNMQFNGIYSINFDKYVVLSSYIYKYKIYWSHLSLHGVSCIDVFIHK